VTKKDGTFSIPGRRRARNAGCLAGVHGATEVRDGEAEGSDAADHRAGRRSEGSAESGGPLGGRKTMTRISERGMSCRRRCKARQATRQISPDHAPHVPPQVGDDRCRGGGHLGWFPLIGTLDLVVGQAGQPRRRSNSPGSPTNHLYPKDVNTLLVDKAVRAVKEVQAMKPAADFLIHGGDLAQARRSRRAETSATTSSRR